MIIPSLFTGFASSFDPRTCLLIMTGWYYPNGGVQPAGDLTYRDDFKWENPVSWQDGREGITCSVSHAWFPAHMLRKVDGVVYGEPFAPASLPEVDDDELYRD